MNQFNAFSETIDLAMARSMPELPGTSYGLEHLVEMWNKVAFHPEQYSASKLGRWLGWAQCAVVVSGVATLDEMKEINLRNSDDDTTGSR